MAQDRHIILAYPNRADGSKTVTTTLSGGAWEADLPLDNLKDKRMSLVTRSTDLALASTQFDIDLGRDFRIQVVALVRHNISLSGRVRYRGYTDADKTNCVYDSGWSAAWPVVYPSDLVDWEDDKFWTGTWSQDVAENYPIFSLKVLNPRIVARYWHIEVDDPTNADGYVEIGRLVIATGWQPTHNIDYGYELGWNVTASEEETLGGALISEEYAAGRFLDVAFNDLTDDEAMAVIMDMQRVLGWDGQLFVVVDPGDTIHMIRRSFLATIRQPKGIAHRLYNKHSNSLMLKEVL